MPPGITKQPVASSCSSPFRSSPISAIRPPSIRMSALNVRSWVTTVPFLIAVVILSSPLMGARHDRHDSGQRSKTGQSPCVRPARSLNKSLRHGARRHGPQPSLPSHASAGIPVTRRSRTPSPAPVEAGIRRLLTPRSPPRRPRHETARQHRPEPTQGKSPPPRCGSARPRRDTSPSPLGPRH